VGFRQVTEGETLKQIILATDLTSRTKAAEERAALLARRLGARLHVLHTGPTLWGRRPDPDHANQALRDVLRALQRCTLQAPTVSVEGGHPEAALIGRAEAIGADLVVIAPPRGWRASASAERIAASSGCSVLIVKDDPVDHYRRIAIAVDRSAASLEACRAADRVSSMDGVCLLHSFVPAAKTSLLVAGVDNAAVAGHVEAERMRAEAAVAHWLQSAGLSHRTPFFIEGDVGRAVAEFAQEHRPDLIVIGCSPARGLKRLLFGSPTRRILDMVSGCDILVAPPARCRSRLEERVSGTRPIRTGHDQLG
jgi:nucleotide-binding universal stress UspA family protein